jgi:hypothetical protein
VPQLNCAAEDHAISATVHRARQLALMALFMCLGLEVTATDGTQERPYAREEYLVRARPAYEAATKALLNEVRSKGSSSYVLIDKADASLVQARDALRTLRASVSASSTTGMRNTACLNAFKEISIAYIPIDIWQDAGLIDPSPVLYPEGKAALDRMRNSKQLDLVAWGSVCLTTK